MATFIERQKILKDKITPYSPEYLDTLRQAGIKSYETQENTQKQQAETYQNGLSKNVHQNYFTFEQLHELCEDADVYVALTKRNCGKTYSYMRLCAELIKEDREFVIVRNSLIEAKTAIRQQFRDYADMFPHPIIIKDDLIYKRLFYEETVGKKTVEKYEDHLVGYIAYLSGKTQKYQGSSYPKVNTIIWDEATNAGKTNKETTDGNKAFGQLVITFFRGKQGCKMYILGNLMNSTDSDGNEIVSDALIREIGIAPDDDFRVITRSSMDTKGNIASVKICYVNTRDLYNTWGLNITNVWSDPTKSKALLENRPSTSGKNIVGEKIFIGAEEKLFGICTRYANKYYVIQIAMDPIVDVDDPNKLKYWEEGVDCREDDVYIIRVTQLNRGTLGFNMEIYSEDPVVCSAYPDILTLVSKEGRFGYQLNRILKGGNIVYVGDNSYSDLIDLMKNNKNKVQEYEDEMFPNAKPKKKRK